MRHILIILSILLLSSPVIGESKTSETFYEWETASGIQWREIGEKDFHAKYKGDVVIGRPHGVGTLVYPDGNSWTKRTSGTYNSLYDVTYGNNKFVTVGKSGTILTSSDGTTWTSRTSGTSNGLRGVAYKE